MPWGGFGALPEVIREGKFPYLEVFFGCCILRAAQHFLWMFPLQFVFKTEPFTSSTTRTVHEELAKAMTAILKPSTDFLTSNKLLKVKYLWFLKWFTRFEVNKNVFLWLSGWCVSALQYSWYFFEALVKSMAQYLIESCRVKVSLSKHVFLTQGGRGGIFNFIIASVGYSLPGLVASHRTTFVLFIHQKSLPQCYTGSVLSLWSNHIPSSEFTHHWKEVKGHKASQTCK